VAEKQRSAGRRILKFTIKFGLAAAIIIWLGYRNQDTLREAFSTFNYWYLVPALACYLSHMVVASWRWYELAKCLNFKLDMAQALSLTMQGYFFSLVIPGGAIGGDVARIGFLARRSPAGTRFDGAVTVLVDRIVGMVSLFGLTLVLLCFSVPLLMNIQVPELGWFEDFKVLIIVGLFALCLGGNLVLVALFFHRRLEKMPGFGMLFRLGNRWSGGFLDHLTGALDIYRSRWRILGWLTLVSVFGVHLMTVASVWLITLGMSAEGPDFLTLVTAVTIGNIAGLVPFTLTGIGIRDVTIDVILKAGGAVAVAAAIPLLYTLIVILGGLSGGLFFVLDSGRGSGVAKEGTK